MDERVAANLMHWNERPKIHERPSEYVRRFAASLIKIAL